jgi:hypothetical protein
MVTEWAYLSGASIGRNDDVTTVGELSSGNLFFGLDFPVDAGCRVEVRFPIDMPITNDL